ncbi:PREDICTED: peptide transporter family 1-like isoform X2 [Nicrophorus vespilloides]|uniref:Peptide transporter family 1-like isoform X2 n=1 Tax=Nicrophorus vespilloides TaxID=110193 RepID=A0ABM1N1Z4_NICVS|nr:PREDICTED: peptide transporter family 1-like isoform X2 [Nicrophorus vespilloides]
MKEKVKYPKSVFFIVSNEFCERFCYYGMRTILTIYLTDMLLYTPHEATIIFHVFTCLVYFFPIFGAMIADSYLGKFRTILYLSIVYALGSVVLAVSSTSAINMPHTEISMVGLVLIALGTGGIKPCVAAFGGDQFILPQQERQLTTFFSMFYFAINFGSFISTFITPLLRNAACLGETHCFPLAFGIPGALMIVSIVIFAAGKRLYRMRQPEGNMVIKVSKCIGNAIVTKSKTKKHVKKEHWLDYAEEKFGTQLVNEIKTTLRVLLLYIPLPVFWALFDQQGSAWTFLARRMNGDLGSYTILPDQMQVVNPVLILVFIPLFEYCIYPIFNKLKILRTPLQRLVVGGLLAAVAFAITAGISMAIEAEEPLRPESGTSFVHIYNNRHDCKLDIEYDGKNTIIEPLQFYKFVTNKESKFGLIKCNEEELKNPDITFKTGKIVGYTFQDKKYLEEIEDDISKDSEGLPTVRTLVHSTEQSEIIEYRLDGTLVKDSKVSDYSAAFKLDKPGDYTVSVGDVEIGKFTFSLGGVYAVLFDKENVEKSNVITVTEPNSLHVLLLIPQYVIITMGEIMFSVTGLEFAYSQAPKSMKSVVQACWLLTTAFGNIIIIIIESIEIFELQSNNFWLYSGLMVIDMVIFSLMAMRYKYIEKEGDEDSDAVKASDSEALGLDNKAYIESEKKQ